MYYIRHYYICPYDQTLSHTLEKEYSIQVDILVNTPERKASAVVFDVSENHPRIKELDELLPPATPTFQLRSQFAQYLKNKAEFVKQVIITYMPQYTEDDFLNAKWLDVRNTTCKIMPENCESVDTYQCFVKKSKLGIPLGWHEVQKEFYTIKSPIKWGRNFFVSAYAHEERLFCGKLTRALLEAHRINGISFSPVLKKSTGQSMDELYQIDATHTIPDSAVVSVFNMQDCVCQQCGMHMLRWVDGRSLYGLRDNFLDQNIDLWQTQPMFLGPPETDAHSAQRRLIISQRMYRMLVDSKLDRGFVFSPLKTL